MHVRLLGSRGRTSSHKRGFTIVELLIVIVVIAILAAIVIVAYNGLIKRAASADLQNDTESAIKQIATYQVLNSSYPTTQSSFNNGSGIKHGPNTTVEYTSNGSTYCLTVSSVKAGFSYMYDLSNGAMVQGVCPGHTGLGGTSFAWTAVTAGGTNTCGLAAGKAYCWGSGVSTPTLVGGLLSGKTVTKISASQSHMCAIADGLAYCWGSNSDGALGNSSTVDSATPVAVTTTGVLNGKTIQDIASGGVFSCALTTDNIMACWGNNGSGQLGTYSTTNRTYPVAVPSTDGSGWNNPMNGKTITSISTGYNHVCAIANGTAYCWGENERSQLGFNGTNDSYVTGAVTTSGVLNGLTISKLVTGYAHTCAVATNSRVYCWQTTQYVTTLNGTGTTSNVPVAVSTSGVLSGKNIVATAGGNTSNCVVDSAGKVYCWGANAVGQLGNNSTTDSYTPVQVADTGALSGKTVTDIAVGGSYGGGYACALASGELYCWGYNGGGELGNGSTTNSSTPVIVTHP